MRRLPFAWLRLFYSLGNNDFDWRGPWRLIPGDHGLGSDLSIAAGRAILGITAGRAILTTLRTAASTPVTIAITASPVAPTTTAMGFAVAAEFRGSGWLISLFGDLVAKVGLIA